MAHSFDRMYAMGLEYVSGVAFQAPVVWYFLVALSSSVALLGLVERSQIIFFSRPRSRPLLTKHGLPLVLHELSLFF